MKFVDFFSFPFDPHKKLKLKYLNLNHNPELCEIGDHVDNYEVVAVTHGRYVWLRQLYKELP
jgi:hypothetical protein